MPATATNILAVGTTAANSTEVNVDAGAIKKVQLYCADGSIPNCTLKIVEKNSAGGWIPVVSDGVPGVLGVDAQGRCSTSALLIGPGIYRVERPALTGEAVGVDVVA